MDHGRVGEHADLRLGAVFVAQTDGVINDVGKLRMAGGLTITRKGQHVGQLAAGRHFLQFLFEFLGNLLGSRQG